MTAKLLDGQALAQALEPKLRQEIEQLKRDNCPPHLVAVQVGEAPASKVYTNMQIKACRSVGIRHELLNLPVDTTQAQLQAKLLELNGRADVTGIILQLPLPVHIDTRAIQAALAPEKDVEGVHPANFGRLFGRTGHVAPCTALAAVELVRSTGVELAGLEAVIVGHSEIVGKPIAMLLLQSAKQAPTVTVCHVATRDLAAHTRQADVLIVATGVRQNRWQAYASRVAKREHPPLPDLGPLLTAEMIKPGAIVVDVAINRIPACLDTTGQPALDERGKVKLVTVGDVDFESARKVAGYLTPVPGGVGPVTVTMLLQNTVRCAQWLLESARP